VYVLEGSLFSKFLIATVRSTVCWVAFCQHSVVNASVKLQYGVEI
jgi:hypothetical protein